jgi:sugar-specific transcriptional regulator TrmB
MESRVLERIGLTKNESIVYQTLLHLGTSKTGKILKNSKLNSGKIYEILESLKHKGLLSESIINNTKHFTAAPPSQVLEYVRKKKEDLDREEKEVIAILPKLEKIREETIQETKSVTYTGLRGIKTAAEEALDSMKPGEDILAMGVTELKDDKFNKFWKRWQKNRIEKKIKQKMIFSERSSFYDFFSRNKFTQVRVLTGITPVTVDIFGDDKTLILNYAKTPSCILIYDRNTAQSFKTFFLTLWSQAER